MVSTMKEFTSFLRFAEHLIVLGAVEKVVEHRLLEHACEEIEKRAQAKIGEYQHKAGPFSAWAPLADAPVQDRIDQGYPANEPLLRSGEMRDSIEHKVIGHEGHVGSDSDIALWQELGTDKIPARSFLGGAAFELEPKIREETGISFSAWLSGGTKRIGVR
jgi:hypothetical protein